MNRVLNAAEWLWEVLVLQGFWTLYILRGAVFLGFFPATAAVYAVVRRWQRKSTEENTAVLFKLYYSEHFKTANKLGWAFLVITAVIVMNFLFIPVYGYEWVRVGMYALLIFLVFIMLILWVFLFPVLVHFDIEKDIMYALVMLRTGLSSLSGVILQMLFCGIFIMAVYFLPPLLIVFGVIPLAILQLAVTFNIYRERQINVLYDSGNKM